MTRDRESLAAPFAKARCQRAAIIMRVGTAIAVAVLSFAATTACTSQRSHATCTSRAQCASDEFCVFPVDEGCDASGICEPLGQCPAGPDNDPAQATCGCGTMLVRRVCGDITNGYDAPVSPQPWACLSADAGAAHDATAE